jgi:hypothetical protein
MTKYNINPPPNDGRCRCCGRQVSGLKTVDTREDDIFGGDMGLFKNFRSFYGQIESSWECRDCLALNEDEYWDKYYENSGKGEEPPRDSIQFSNGSDN